MGVRGHGDWLRGRYPTAMVSDSNDRLYLVSIKRTIGEFFVTEIGDNLYVFTTKDARILTMGDLTSRQSKVIMYDTSNFMPIDTAKITELAQCLDANGLRRMDASLLKLFSLLGRAESKKELEVRKAIASKKKAGRYTVHEAKDMFDLIAKHADMFPEEAAELKLYLEELGKKEIIAPVGKVADFLTDELVATSPSFLGELLSRHARIDRENRTMSNTPKTSAVPWLKWGLVMAMVVGIVCVVGVGAQQGWFSGLSLGIGEGLDFSQVGAAFSPGGMGGGGGVSGPDCSAAGIQGRYASPLDLKIAVETGAETCPLPEEVAKSLEFVQAPIATATPATPAPAP